MAPSGRRRSHLVAIAIGVALGIIVGTVFGRTRESADWVTAAATIALTAFAFVQLIQIQTAQDAAESQRRDRLESFATLARRSCEAAVNEREYYVSDQLWAVTVGSRFDTLEAQFLEIRSLAAGVEGSAARQAFDSFVSAADRINLLSSENTAMTGVQSKEMAEVTIQFFTVAAEALERIATQSANEVALPRGFAKMIVEYRKYF